MVKRTKLVAVLAATTCLAAGAAYAAEQAAQPPAAQSAAMKDAGKLSADGSKAYIDVALTRLAIFDGRTNDAKKYVSEADSEFDKAKSDDSVFLKAEADLKTADQMKAASGKGDMAKGGDTAKGDTAKGEAAGSEASTSAKDTAPAEKTADNESATTPKRWLPVDAAMSLDEDFTANPQKVAAVANANKKLAAGDKKGALDTLKLADVNLDYVMAVVPLDKTLADVHEAASEVDQGKYYEASQLLRQVQASTRYDIFDINGVPKANSAKQAATH